MRGEHGGPRGMAEGLRNFATLEFQGDQIFRLAEIIGEVEAIAARNAA
jgi:hypothetical protein